MITATSGRFVRISGSAVTPSMSGISMSRITTSGLVRSRSSSAFFADRCVATTSMPTSSWSQRETMPRTTRASSMTITLIAGAESGAETRAALGMRTLLGCRV